MGIYLTAKRFENRGRHMVVTWFNDRLTWFHGVIYHSSYLWRHNNALIMAHESDPNGLSMV